MDLSKKYPGKVHLSVKLKRVVWNIVSCILFRPFVTKIFRSWRIMILRLFGAEIKWDAEVYASAKIWAPWKLKMGHRSCLGPNVICYNQDWVILENDAIVSQYTFLCTASHDTEKQNTAYDSLITAPILIDEKAWIGSRAFIGLGVHIGKLAIVGATASVYKNVLDYQIVGGNPAKLLKVRKLKNVVSGGVILFYKRLIA